LNDVPFVPAGWKGVPIDGYPAPQNITEFKIIKIDVPTDADKKT
jgi:hypothetical protein